MRGFFVTATGTGAGKTTVTAALARALVAQGKDVVALKPIETGVDPVAADALALAEACGRPELAADRRWYRARPPLSPHAAQLEGHAPIDLPTLAAAVREHAGDRLVLVEGAGGLLVPLDERATLADLAVELALPLLLVAPNRLGVLSETLTAAESADRRSLSIAAVVLNQPAIPTDASAKTNARVLAAHLPRVPILELGSERIWNDSSLAPLIQRL